MIDIRTEIRQAFEREQSAFPPPAALREQVVSAVNARHRSAAPARTRADLDLHWLVVAAAVLLTIAIVAALVAVRLNIWHPTLVKPGPAGQICIPQATQLTDRFARVHGCITYSDGSQIVAVDPYHPANRIVLGPANGRLPIAWSRDGSRLLLVSTTDLYVMNADGSQTRLTSGDAYRWEGSLSPDGSNVVYDRWQETVVPGGHTQTTGLYVVAAQGGAPRLIAKSDFCSTVPDDQNAQIQQGSCDQSGAGSSLSFPAWSPDGSRIAYADNRHDLATDEVWTMRADGTNQRRLVSLGSCGATQPTGCTNGLAWSPDGSQLAIHSAGGIYVMRSDGSSLHRISKDGVQPFWSPDGSSIAFTRGGELFVMAPDGRNETLLKGVVVSPPYGWTWNPVTPPSSQFALVRGYITYSDATDIWAVNPNQPSNRISLGPSNASLDPIAWSQDGSRLLLQEQKGSGLIDRQRDLWIMKADGSQTRLTNDGLSGEGSFSPDGRQVVFTRYLQGLYVVDSNGGTPRQISKFGESPAWSPDGSRIAFAVYLELSPAYQIWTVNPDGTNSRQLLDLGECGLPGCSGGLAWSPDGSILAFHSRRGPFGPNGYLSRTQAIYLVRADGSGLHRINDGGSRPAWSPDGSRLAFSRGGEVCTMAADGSDVRQLEGSGILLPCVGVIPEYATGLMRSIAWNPVK